MQIARSDAQLIVAGLDGSLARMHRLEASMSLTPHERSLLRETIEATQLARDRAFELLRGQGLDR
jgi:hypothetical protein